MQVDTILEGHSKRVSGLAFSNDLNVLVSSGADAQVSVEIIWNKSNADFP
jgi:WD40 repeat protein